jgi:FAD-dependent oxidoreductase domain-containing protein 1
MEKAEVVIVGGGIVGSAIAYYLSTSGACDPAGILLIEQDPSYGMGSTARSAGGLRQQFSTPENIAMSQFTLRLFRNLETVLGRGADVGFREQGYLLLASPGSESILAENIALQQSMAADVVRLDPDGMAGQFPWIATEGIAAGGFGRTGEGWFDPPALAALFRAAARDRGVRIVHDRVGAILGSEQIEQVRLKGGTDIALGALVNAAGPWSGEVAAMCGVELPVEPRKRYVYVIDCRDAPEGLAKAPLTVDPSGVWFRPEGRFFLCGKSPAESEEPPATNLDDVDHAFFESEVWPALAARVPAFDSVKVVNAWAGYYDYNTLDQNAVIGRHPRIANLYFANGFSGHGAQQAAAAGQAVAELITQGRYLTIDLARLGFERIERNEPLFERNVI